MIRKTAMRRAKEIGDDSWELSHFAALPKNASRKKQVEALNRDAEWLKDHVQAMCSEIDYLIRDIIEKTA